jgi:Flp pilus assembly protein TadD
METAVGLAPENPRLHFALAQAYQRAGRREDAAREKEEFLRLDSASNGPQGPDPAEPGGSSSPPSPAQEGK